jgi:hypothetical protein
MGIEGDDKEPVKNDAVKNEADRARAPQEAMSVTPGISVPKDSNIIGGGAPGEGSDIATASGPSDSGGG